MSSEPAVTLYDIPSTLTPQAWSPNTWKTRLVLNYKRIPYKTVWVDYPDIKATMQRIGGTPTGTSPDGPLYTLPAIVDARDAAAPVTVVDSLAIAEYLDAAYPARPVFPKTGKALELTFMVAAGPLFGPHLMNIMMHDTWEILAERSRPYFRETRERWYFAGKALEDLSPEGPAREADWAAVEHAWDRLAGMLDKNGEGSEYVAGGSEPTHADFLLVAFLAWIVAVLPEEWEKRVSHWSGGRWARLWARSEEWRAVV